MTAASTGYRLRSEPLEARIVRAELRLFDRRRRLSASAALLSHSVRRQLASPWTLLAAGGLGYLAGDLARVFANPGRAEESHTGGSSLFAGALGIVTLVRSLLKAFPVVGTPDREKTSPAATVESARYPHEAGCRRGLKSIS